MPVIFTAHSNRTLNIEPSSTDLHSTVPFNTLFSGFKNVPYVRDDASNRYGAVLCVSSRVTSSYITTASRDDFTPSARLAMYGSFASSFVRITHRARFSSCLHRSYNTTDLSKSPNTARSHVMKSDVVRARQSVAASTSSAGLSTHNLTMSAPRARARAASAFFTRRHGAVTACAAVVENQRAFFLVSPCLLVSLPFNSRAVCAKSHSRAVSRACEGISS